MRVLVIEDDGELAEAIADGPPPRRDWRWTRRSTAGPGLDRALVNGYDVIVLDRDLPGAARRRRMRTARHPGPGTVLMLTAAGH